MDHATFDIAYPARHYDMVVVGARAAGASTAMLAARQGARVLLVDRDAHGTDTLSTHALMRGAVMQLDRWGVLEKIIAAGTPAITRTVFHYGDEAVPVDIRPSGGTGALYAPRRTVLDSALVAAAKKAGATVRFGLSFQDATVDPNGRVRGATLRDASGEVSRVSCDLLIGADGRRSSVARALNAAEIASAPHATAAIYAHATGLPNQGYRWHYRKGVTGGAIPTNDGAHCVFASVTPVEMAHLRKELTPDAILAELVKRLEPALGLDLASAPCRSRPRLFRGAPGFMRQASGNGWALVGDAGYFKDPATAHGITDALRDAEILVRCAARGGAGLLTYAAARRQLSSELFRITDRIASFDWSLHDLKALHRDLNREMKREQAFIASEFGEGSRRLAAA
ncbi:MAG: NAD(P)/FAD-dependent oxidoreductase [Pseudomonadota bacterium]